MLSGLAAGRIPPTHEGLDELPRSRALDHLRQTLVAVGALPERDEELIRLEAFLHELLTGERDTERRRLLHRYLNWHLVRRLRSRNNGRPATRQQSLMIRRLARGTITFLDWLDAHGLTLGTCQQADLDGWLADGHAAYREEAGRFIRWARAAKLTAGYLPSAARWNGPAVLLDHQDRWDTARRLLHDDSLKPEDRLAGLLVLLYAQHTTAIGRMTVSQIQDTGGTVTICLGLVPVQLPEPVAALARTVAADRQGHATIGAAKPSPWLFPGGQPGRPVSGDRLTRRLEALGIRPRRTRSAALFQLATEIPAAILARTLGISTDVAVTWQRLSAGDWAAYAADVSRRPPRQRPVFVTSRNTGTGMSPGTECPVCGEHLPGPDPRRTGRKPGYCSNACKAKAYRARQRSGEHVSAADPALLSSERASAGDRYVRTTEIHQRISDLTTALADTASGQQALFAPPRTVRRMRPADTAAALHLLIAELAALAAAATSQTHRTHTRPATGAPQTPPLFGEPEAGH